jgi:hypothetical protein
MSTPDARLNAAERAALADLEAAAAAADPTFASRLKGSRRNPAFSSARIQVRRLWLLLCTRARHLGGPLAGLGLVLIVVGLSRGLAVSLAGLALLFLGLWVATERLAASWLKRRR